MAFPTSPSNDDLHTEFGRTFKYSSASNSWSVATPDAPEDNALTTQGYVDVQSLPLTDVAAGSKAFVQDGNKLFIFTGSGWFEIATINTAPTITAGADATYALNSDGTPTVITLQATDPEGTPIIWGYQVTSGSLEDITVTNVDNVFTITPGTAPATFDLAFTASDGVNIDTSVSSFTLTFGSDWTLTTQQAKIQASDKEGNDYFGYSVSIDGDTVAVGAYQEDSTGTNAGAVYVFTRSGTTWTQQAKLAATDIGGIQNVWVGFSVAISGDTLVAGGYRANDRGAAYVFTRSGTTWTQQAKLISTDIQQDDWFGYSVAIDGDTIVASAMGEDTGATNTGAAYIFTRSGTTWTQQAKIQASDRSTSAYFGSSAAIDGDTVIVGAFGKNAETGAAYIFARSGTTWTQQAKILSSDIQAEDKFGHSVAIDGDTVIVGAWGEDTGANAAGSAYVFTRSGTTWTQQAKIQASDPEAVDLFGYSVAIEADTVIVSAPVEDPAGLTSAGSAYIFTRDGTTWTQQIKILASDRASSDEFGTSVAISGDTVIVGAKYEDPDGTGDAGAAYIFVGG